MSEENLGQPQPSTPASELSKPHANNTSDMQFNQPVSTVSRLKKLEERVEALEERVEDLSEEQESKLAG
ncbi:MAG: hypothetical protein JO316_22550 [Abitibacteriaceae bacterium]|nr:hypothetical protein [Abditibacteriaceae bacterium]MBV9868145.1 hypothetical protein [Abditibacteriaceae bacterium]